MRTGVVQPLPGIGDMIWLQPALAAIAAAAPEGKIALFTKPSTQASALFSDTPYISWVLPLPSERGAGAALANLWHAYVSLRRGKIDRLFILHQSPRYRLAARLAGIREIIAYPPELAKSKKNGWEKSLAFLRQSGIPVANTYSQLAMDAGTVEAMRQKFATHPRPWFIIAPGASTGTRLWPVERFAVCADAVAKETGGTIFLIGSPKEGERVEAVRKLCAEAEKIVPVVGLPFDQVMGLIACSAGLLGNDSGPANVAAALGKPAFPLCGTSEPPLHSPHMHLILPDLQEDKGNGMEAISAEHALAVVREGLSIK